jgi:SynChlorMet cassette radical SAM/SPASM protein ScmE
VPNRVAQHIQEFLRSLISNGLAGYEGINTFKPMEIMWAPSSLDIEITNRCNLQCKYCSHFTSAGDVEEDLPKEEWLAFFEELSGCLVTSVTLSGGEPFIREDFPDIIEGVVRNRMSFTILSNGTLISDEMAAYLASTERCDGVQISIDGSVPIIHDAFRGSGNFIKAIEGIERLRKNEVSVSVRVTIHRQNVHDLEDVARLLLEDIGLPSFSTNSAAYLGLCRRNSEQIQLTAEETSLAMETLLRLNQKYKDRVSAQAGPLANAHMWMEMEKARAEKKKIIPGRGYLTGCGGTMSKMAVRADGVMVPCNQLNHIELGRINEDRLLEVWQNHHELYRLRNRYKIPLTEFDLCKECEYVLYCTGNCPATAYTISGEVNRPSIDGCLKTFLDDGGRLPDGKLF